MKLWSEDGDSQRTASSQFSFIAYGDEKAISYPEEWPVVPDFEIFPAP